jgi:hypothetical protein
MGFGSIAGRRSLDENDKNLIDLAGFFDSPPFYTSIKQLAIHLLD